MFSVLTYIYLCSFFWKSWSLLLLLWFINEIRPINYPNWIPKIYIEIRLPSLHSWSLANHYDKYFGLNIQNHVFYNLSTPLHRRPHLPMWIFHIHFFYQLSVKDIAILPILFPLSASIIIFPLPVIHIATRVHMFLYHAHVHVSFPRPCFFAVLDLSNIDIAIRICYLFFTTPIRFTILELSFINITVWIFECTVSVNCTRYTTRSKYLSLIYRFKLNFFHF